MEHTQLHTHTGKIIEVCWSPEDREHFFMIIYTVASHKIHKGSYFHDLKLAESRKSFNYYNLRIINHWSEDSSIQSAHPTNGWLGD